MANAIIDYAYTPYIARDIDSSCVDGDVGYPSHEVSPDELPFLM